MSKWLFITLAAVLILISVVFLSKLYLFNLRKQNPVNSRVGVALPINSNNYSETPNLNLEIAKNNNNLAEQQLGDLKWKDYKNNELGISFTYPDNLNSICFKQSGSSLITTGLNKDYIARMSVCENMGYIVDITVEEKWDGTVEKWIDQSNLLKGIKTETNFNGQPAFFYKITEVQQIPSNAYILKYKGNILEIEIMRTEKGDVFNNYVIKKIGDSIKFE